MLTCYDYSCYSAIQTMYMQPAIFIYYECGNQTLEGLTRKKTKYAIKMVYYNVVTTHT